MGVNITLDAGALAALDKAVLRAAELTIEALKTDVIASQVMPYNDGTMQNTDTFTDVSSSGDTVTAALVTGQPAGPPFVFSPGIQFPNGEQPQRRRAMAAALDRRRQTEFLRG